MESYKRQMERQHSRVTTASAHCEPLMTSRVCTARSRNILSRTHYGQTTIITRPPCSC